jgi:hypothetical protein
MNRMVANGMLMRWYILTVGLLLLSHVGTAAQERSLTVQVKDAESGQALPARIYLSSAEGKPYFFQSIDPQGSAIRYEKQNWINAESVENHTTVSPHPCVAQLPPGRYTLTVERGKTYRSHVEEVPVADRDVSVTVSLKPWIEMSKLGWYSGDLHVHRELHELPNVIMAEDLNVVFPLTNWVTLSDTPPSAGDKNLRTELPKELIRVDDEHVIWPRSTEYEIFTVGKQQHTLGALFVLGHSEALQTTVPPWKPVVEAARASDPGVLFDMDKLAWPFAMTLPVIAPDATYELTNNHLWRTQFAFREWYTPAPAFIAPPFGANQGGESDWIDFTLGMYYTLLNCGLRLPPSAGTANGVHPVPAGFGRVYVHLADGFDFQSWKQGLQAGRSFVTTGPMLMATANGKFPGESFELESSSSGTIGLRIEVVSEEPISFAEVLINGVPEQLLRASGERTAVGAYRYVFDSTVRPTRSGWIAVRCFEERPEGRVRFAHTAPWYVRVDGQPVRPPREQREYLVDRMRDEIQRSRGIVSAAGIQEYEQALEFYRALEVQDDTADVLRSSRALQADDRERWLRNMIVDHRFTADEVRLAAGMSIAQAQQEVDRLSVGNDNAADQPRLRVMPYPGGRHPRRGFLNGAIDPQRETKISVFPAWKDAGYVVVDVPEAIFSNLGLTYLAHTHVPTIWSERSIQLEPLEWMVEQSGLRMQRRLPNGISFGSQVSHDESTVTMEMWLTNGTDQPLTGLRSQVCVMLKGLVGFNSQRRRPERVDGSLVAVQGDRGNRWVITSWRPIHRAWTNSPVPCLHADPVFPDCAPGETVRVDGKLWFYEGDDIDAEIQRLKASIQS